MIYWKGRSTRATSIDFTGADCQAWMREAGFSQTRVEPLTDTVSMVVAIK
jgi:hypothetical protein